MFTRTFASTLVALAACGSAPPAPEDTAASSAACRERFEGGAKVGSATEAVAACRRACDHGDAEGCRFEAALWRGRDVRDTAAAARASERGCALGSSKACGDFADHLATGDGIRADPGRALALHDKSCADGYAIACHNLGVAHESGNTGGGSPIDLPRAYAAYTRACDLGQGEACHRAGLFAEHGRGLPAPDPVAALGWHAKAWQKGHHDGCLAAARLVLAGRARFSADADTWDARLFDAACKLGDQPACVELGWRAWLGRGLDVDEARALALATAACPTTPSGCALAGYLRGEHAGAHAFLRPRCAAGDRVACEELALVLAGGRPEDRAWAAGVAHEACGRGVADMCGLEAELMRADRPVEALALHEKACVAGHPESCHAAGALLETDPGGALSKAGRAAPGERLRAAVERYVDGCDLDHDASCAAASRLVRDGWDKSDDAELDAWRVKLFEHTCDRGDATACGAFALELYRGRGIAADHGRAREIGTKACEGGDAVGCLVAGVYWWRKAGDISLEGALEKGLPLLERGCSLGNREACAWAGVALASCRGAPCDEARARPLLDNGCRDGFTYACERAKALKERQAKQTEAERAAKACERGDGRACLRAGDLWGEVDPGEASRAHLYERGCDAKIGAACSHRASLESVWKPDSRRPWLQRGCDLGDGGGCGALVEIVPEKDKGPLRERACGLGHGGSCGWLGSAALHGWSRPVDPAEGERLLRKACELGSSYDCGTLAYAYRTGIGLPKSTALAAKYEAKKCALGATLGCSKTPR